MGYKHPHKTFLLRFEDKPGLEVQMRTVSVGKLMDMAELADDVKAGKASTSQAMSLFTMFADRLVAWTVEDDEDQPVPANLDGVRSLDTDLFMTIFEFWFESMTESPSPLPQPSGNGLSPMEASLPMVPISVPQPN